MPDPTQFFDDPFDETEMFDDPLTVAEAATIYRVTEVQIRHWWHRGHLAPAMKDQRGRPRFYGIDVLRAQAKAEDNAARTQASNLATRRASRQP